MTQNADELFGQEHVQRYRETGGEISALKPDERRAMWRQMTEVWPDYDSYQERTDREIPVVVLERE
jgi:hypothetical protein